MSVPPLAFHQIPSESLWPVLGPTETAMVARLPIRGLFSSSHVSSRCPTPQVVHPPFFNIPLDLPTSRTAPLLRDRFQSQALLLALTDGLGAAPLIKRSLSLAAQTGWFVISNKIRIATRAYTEATRLFTNHPRPLRGLPSFERRGMNSLQQLSSISKLLASGNHQKSDVYATTPTHFATCRIVLHH